MTRMLIVLACLIPLTLASTGCRGTRVRVQHRSETSASGHSGQTRVTVERKRRHRH